MARPRQFDEQQVLEAAVGAFWARGYEATSTRDLVRVTGLSQPSLYNAFGDKRALFRRALEHYLDHTLRERMARLEATLPPGQAIAAYFGEIIERSVADRQQRGCLLVNSALEATDGDAEFKQAIADELELIRAFFLRCLRAAQAQGELPDRLVADAAAAHLLTVVLGIRVLARANPDRRLMSEAAHSALGLLGLPVVPRAASAAPAASSRRRPRRAP